MRKTAIALRSTRTRRPAHNVTHRKMLSARRVERPADSGTESVPVVRAVIRSPRDHWNGLTVGGRTWGRGTPDRGPTTSRPQLMLSMLCLDLLASEVGSGAK